jgi:maleylacetate reductase
VTAGLDFTYDGMPQRILFGVGRLTELAGELDRLSARRLVLIADTSQKDTADDLVVTLGERVVARLYEVRQHVPEALAEHAIQAAVSAGADGLITLGGGSATGLGKAVAHHLGLPVVAIPSTYAGSEATPIYGITGRHKVTGRDERVLPRVVIYDPALTVSLPGRTTGTTSFNAMAHCIEALYSPGANPISSLLAMEGLARFATWLPVAVSTPTDIEARSNLLFGAYLAGSSFAVAGTALHHKLCHVLGGTFGLDHGEANSVMLPYVVAFNASATADALHGVGVTADGLRDLAEQLDLPTSLAEIGMPAAGLDEAAELGVAAVGSANPRPVDVAGLRQLLEDAYVGRWPAEGGT